MDQMAVVQRNAGSLPLSWSSYQTIHLNSTFRKQPLVEHHIFVWIKMKLDTPTRIWNHPINSATLLLFGTFVNTLWCSDAFFERPTSRKRTSTTSFFWDTTYVCIMHESETHSSLCYRPTIFRKVRGDTTFQEQFSSIYFWWLLICPPNVISHLFPVISQANQGTYQA